MKKTLKLIAAALAAVTAMSCTPVSAYADKLSSNGGIMYRYSDRGQYLGRFTGWTKSRGKMYFYLDGVKVTKNTVINGRRFKFDRNGVYLGKYTGWTHSAEGVRYWKNGEMYTDCWIKMKNGKYRYLGSDGCMRTGWSLVTRNGKGKFSFFDSNGYWDGKTYNTGYGPETLADVFKDIDFFSAEEYYAVVRNIDEDFPDEFYGSEILLGILDPDLYRPLTWDSARGSIGDITDNMAKIVIRSSESDSLELEIADGGVGNEAYLYCPYYGFGLKLSDRYAFSKLAEEIGLREWDYTQSSGDDEEVTEYEEPEPLDYETEQEIIADFLKYKSSNSFWRSKKPSELCVLAYYGTFAGGEVVIVYGDEFECTDDYVELEIAGYTVEVGSGSYELLLHRNGTFVPLAKAYDLGYLSKEDIAAIAYCSQNR